MDRHKWPRTPHLPDSPGGTKDDERLTEIPWEPDDSVVVTEKMDGECTTMTREFIHARSMDSRDHESRHYVKGLWGGLRHQIPEGVYVVGENVFARHSIPYDALEGYFLVFTTYRDTSTGRMIDSWDATKAYAEMLHLPTVPELYRGAYGLRCADTSWWRGEGYVIRFEDSIPFLAWEQISGKWVRENHVQTDEHWMSQPVVPNKLRA